MRSEPETAAMLKVAQHFKPHVWMNAHSGMEALFMPCALPRSPSLQKGTGRRLSVPQQVAARVSSARACAPLSSRHSGGIVHCALLTCLIWFACVKPSHAESRYVDRFPSYAVR